MTRESTNQTVDELEKLRKRIEVRNLVCARSSRFIPLLGGQAIVRAEIAQIWQHRCQVALPSVNYTF